MKITHKGISMLLKHHGLNEDCSDDDIKNCVSKAIKNSDEALPEESEMGGEDTVENREQQEEIDDLKTRLAAAEEKLKAKGEPVHNRNSAKTPKVELEIQEPDPDLGIAIANRASELQTLHPGMTLATAFQTAETEITNRKE